MSLHDAYARVTPFEVAFPDEVALDELASRVSDEAAARGIDPSLPGAFLTLASVGAFVRGLQAPEASEEDFAEALRRYGVLIFQAIRFLSAGRPLFLLEAEVTRRIVDEATAAEPDPPAEAGYVQLPQHLFWASGPDGAPESLDGIFWSVSTSRSLHVLPITGLLPDREGFGVLPLPDAPLADAPKWLNADVRGPGADFASSLPGGEWDRLYGLETAGEVLKLLARFFAYAAGRPEALGADEPPSEGAADRAGPRASGLPYTRVTLVA